VFVRIGPGVALGYRRTKTAGTWVLRVADGIGGHWTKRIADADDLQAADGGPTLDFWQAQERARGLARASGKDEGDSGKLVTVAESPAMRPSCKRAAATAPTRRACACICRTRWPERQLRCSRRETSARGAMPWSAGSCRRPRSTA